MVIKVIELCEVSPLDEDVDNEVGKRMVIYESSKDSFIEAILDYYNNFNGDNIIESEDDFEGECLNTLDYVSFEFLKDYE